MLPAAVLGLLRQRVEDMVGHEKSAGLKADALGLQKALQVIGAGAGTGEVLDGMDQS